MQIKNILLITIFSSLFMLGCSSKNSDQRYNVAGTIKNAANQKLLLQEIPFGGKPIITLDSVTLTEKGDFSFDFISKEEGIYRIANEKEMEIIFVNDEKNIQINADANSYLSYEIKGSKASESLISFLKSYKKIPLFFQRYTAWIYCKKKKPTTVPYIYYKNKELKK